MRIPVSVSQQRKPFDGMGFVSLLSATWQEALSAVFSGKMQASHNLCFPFIGVSDSRTLTIVWKYCSTVMQPVAGIYSICLMTMVILLLSR
ncbi:hypothetical protein BJX64DRAFT_20656 [Aspergillus heterothallicus]